VMRGSHEGRTRSRLRKLPKLEAGGAGLESVAAPGSVGFDTPPKPKPVLGGVLESLVAADGAPNPERGDEGRQRMGGGGEERSEGSNRRRVWEHLVGHH
jgi:hypothetical protein